MPNPFEKKKKEPSWSQSTGVDEEKARQLEKGIASSDPLSGLREATLNIRDLFGKKKKRQG
jgi:hypothetical protein